MLNYGIGTELKFIHVISKLKMRCESSATLLYKPETSGKNSYWGVIYE